MNLFDKYFPEVLQALDMDHFDAALGMFVIENCKPKTLEFFRELKRGNSHIRACHVVVLREKRILKLSPKAFNYIIMYLVEAEFIAQGGKPKEGRWYGCAEENKITRLLAQIQRYRGD